MYENLMKLLRYYECEDQRKLNLATAAAAAATVAASTRRRLTSYLNRFVVTRKAVILAPDVPPSPSSPSVRPESR